MRPKGWVHTLPKVQFDIMYITNVSTSFTPFQLHFRKVPCMLPPIILQNQENIQSQTANELIMWMQLIKLEAQDNLLTVKIQQAHQENMHRQLTFPFKVGDRVVLSMANRQWVYKSGDSPCVPKFMPCFNGPYPIISINKPHSTVTLALLAQSHQFPVFHTSKVKLFWENNDNLFPTHALHPPTWMEQRSSSLRKLLMSGEKAEELNT